MSTLGIRATKNRRKHVSSNSIVTLTVFSSRNLYEISGGSNLEQYMYQNIDTEVVFDEWSLS